MSSVRIMLTSGFAMFSMFFGSGNLVFPILIGINAQQSYPYSIIGFVLTAVFLPLLGLIGIMQFNGDRHSYFYILGKIPAFILTFMMLGLLGPFGIIPRCASVSFGGFNALFPSAPLWVFNAGFCTLILGLIWQRNKIIDIIGVYLTPIKLGSFILLIVIGLALASEPLRSGTIPLTALGVGLSRGYQTLDLIASFFCGSAIYEYITQKINSNSNSKVLPPEELKRKALRLGMFGGIFGGLLLTLCYIGFVLLGAKYGHILQGVPGESLLVIIAKETLGRLAMPFIAVTFIVSCLATSTITASLFADFLQEDIARNKLTRKQSVIITVLISYTISLLGFEEICKILDQILGWIYPFLMAFTVFQMYRYKYKNSKIITKN